MRPLDAVTELNQEDYSTVRTVDIIVPLRNESEYLDTLLGQLLNQTHPINKIFMVVAPSEDTTLDTCLRAAKLYPQLVVLENPKFTAPHAMNTALEASTADAWARIDGHTEAPLDLIEVLVREINLHEVACVGPVLEPGYSTTIQEAVGLAMSSPWGVGNATFRTGIKESGPTDAVAFGMYRTVVTDRAGRFETNMTRNQDDQFNTRLRQQGATIWLTNKVAVKYYPRASFRRLAQQYYEYGHWRVVGTLEYGNELRARQLAPLLLVLSLTVALAAQLLRPPKRSLRLVPVAYGSVLALQVGREMKRTHRPLPSLLSSYAALVMHFAYGVGSLSGIWGTLRRIMHGNNK